MNRVFFAAPRRAIGALSLAACAAGLAAGCAATASPTPVPTAAGGSGASANASAAGGGATDSATATSSAAAGAGGSGGSGSGSGGGSGSGAVGGAGGGSAPAASSKAQAAGPGMCSVRYLNASTGLTQGAMGSTYVNIVFKNLNNAPCTLYGYPGVALGAGTPVNQVGQPASRDNAVASQAITLAPGGYAYATLHLTDVLNYPTTTCKPSPTTWLLVYPPNTSNLLYVPYKSNACTSSMVTMAVQAVQAGNGGG